MSEQIFIEGEAGAIEIFQDIPDHIRAVALVTHPHPLMGGNPQHKIPQLIADFLCKNGCLVWRPSFRGMGQSAGSHDHGHGESRDIALLAQQLQQQYPQVPFLAGGFSFGAYTWTKAWQLLAPAQRPRQLVLAGLPCGEVRGEVDYQTPGVDGDILLIHGANDDICPLAAVMEWAEPQKHPITVIPGANHFFTGYLKPLTTVLQRYYQF